MGCFREYRDVLWDMLALAWLLLLYSVYAVGGLEVTIYSEWDALVVGLQLLVPALAVAPLHEGVHALVLRLAGYRVSFGASTRGGIPVAYTRPLEPVNREDYIVMALAPLAAFHIALPLGAVLGGPLWLKVLFIYNCVGSSGDVLATLSALRLPPGKKVLDLGDHFAECMPQPLGRLGRAVLYGAVLLSLAAAAL